VKFVSRLRTVLYRLGLLLGLGIFIYQFWLGQLAVRGQGDLLLDLPLLLAAYLLFALGNLVQMLGWAGVLHLLGYPLPVSVSVRNYALTFLPRYIPGTVWGYLSRSEWLRLHHGVPYRASTVGSLLEIGALVGTALLLNGSYLFVTAYGMAIVLVVSLVGLALVLGGCLAWAVAQSSLLMKYLGGVHVAATGRGPLNYIGLMVLYSGMWLIHGLGLLCLLNGLQGTLSLDLAASTFAMTGAWVAGFLVFFVPTGMGVREITMAALLDYTGAFASGFLVLVPVFSRFLLMLAELTWLVIQFLQRRVD
jgi:glycosyltransferase 2 family protein